MNILFHPLTIRQQELLFLYLLQAGRKSPPSPGSIVMHADTSPTQDRPEALPKASSQI